MRLARLALISSLSVVALIAQGCGGDEEAPAVAGGGSSGTAGTANGGDGNGGEGNGGEGNGGEGNGGEGNAGEGPGDAAAGTAGDGDPDGGNGDGDGDGGDGDGDDGGDSGMLDDGSVSDSSLGDSGPFQSDASLLTDAGNSFFCPGTPADGDPCFPGGTQCLYTGGVECTCNNPPGPNNSAWGCSQ
jgi:hypothetical protein